MSLLGAIRGQMILDVRQALASYTAVRLAHLSTVTALRTGGGALMAAGTGVAAVGLLMAGGIYAAVNAAAEFERKLDYFSAVSNATQAQYDAIREKALQLGQDTIFSAGQIADSFVELGKAGVGAEDIINGIGEAVANLGAAADIPLDTAAQILMSAVQTFHLGAEEAVGVADLLAGAANASIVEVQDLGLSLKYAGGVAASLGLPINDVVTALGLLGTYGIRGSTAGTSLRQILVSLTGASGPATAALKELGIITADGANQFFNADGSAKSLAEIFQVLQNATAGLTQEQKLAYLRTIFQNRALAAAIALTDEGAAGFERMSAAIGSTTAMDVASERLDNLSGDIEILKGNLETLAIESGGSLQEFARGFVQGLTEVVQWFSNLSPETQAMILKFLAIAAAGFVVIGFLGMLAGALLNIVAFVIQFVDAIALIAAGISAWASGAGSAIVGVLSGPVGWIILAVVALVAAFIWLWNNVDGFKQFFIDSWENIKTSTANVVEWFGTLPAWFSNLWNTIVTWARTTWESFTSWLGAIPGRIRSFFSGIGAWFTNLWNTVVSWARGVWDSFIGFISAIPGRIADFFQQLPYRIGFIIGLVVGLMVRGFLQIWDFFTVTIPQIVQSVITWFQGLPDQLGAIWSNIWTSVVAWWTNISTTVSTKAQEIWTAITTWFSQLPGNVATFFSNVWTNITTWLSNAVATARTKASEIVSGIRTWLSQLPGQIRQFFTDAYNNLRSTVTNWVNAARTAAADIISNIRNGLASLPGIVSGVVNNAITAFRGAISRAFSAARDFAAGLWNGFKAGLGIRSPSYIEKAMWAVTDTIDTETTRLRRQVSIVQGIGDRLNNIGTETGLGFANGVSTVAETLADQVARVQAMQRDMTGVQLVIASNRAAIESLPNINPVSPYGAAERPAQVVDARTQTWEFNAYGDDAEIASDQSARKMRTLATMGAFS